MTAADDRAGTAFGGKLEFAGAAPDLSHVVFASKCRYYTASDSKVCTSGKRGRAEARQRAARRMPASEPPW